MNDVAYFEWRDGSFVDQDGDRVKRHYLVTPGGQIVADVEEPTGGRLAYVADSYYADNGRSYWIHLQTAMAHCEMIYLDSLRSKPKLESKVKK